VGTHCTSKNTTPTTSLQVVQIGKGKEKEKKVANASPSSEQVGKQTKTRNRYARRNYLKREVGRESEG